MLEPSPPAVVDGEWFADDPVAVADRVEGRQVVSPVRTGDLTWDRGLHDHPQHSSWVSWRGLGGYRRLGASPALHRLAVYVVSAARRRTNGKIAPRWTLGGFTTPFFGDDEQVRVADSTLARQSGDACEAEPIGSLADAAALAFFRSRRELLLG